MTLCDTRDKGNFCSVRSNEEASIPGGTMLVSKFWWSVWQPENYSGSTFRVEQKNWYDLFQISNVSNIVANCLKFFLPIQVFLFFQAFPAKRTKIFLGFSFQYLGIPTNSWDHPENSSKFLLPMPYDFWPILTIKRNTSYCAKYIQNISKK